MKLLFFNIVFFITYCDSLPQSGWFLQNTGVNDSLRTVSFINSQTGFAAGSNGRILKTTDSGDNWFQLVSNTDSDIFSLCASSDDFIVCCGENGLVLCSSDSGLNWSVSRITSLRLRSVFLTDSLNGHITGDSGLIMRTTDAGINWNIQYYSNPVQFNSVYFANSSQGWIAGYGAVLYTANKGVTWTDQFIDGKLILNSVFFKDSLHGWTGYYDNSTFGPEILRTSSGGNDWRGFSAGSNSYSLSLFFTDTLNGWSAGYYGSIVRTSNGGLNWINQISGTDKHLFSVFFVNSSTGWIAGENGIILKTTTGGVITSIISNYQTLPEENMLLSNYPNPFNSSTSIKFRHRSDLNNSERFAALKVFDICGKLVSFRNYELSSLHFQDNTYEINFDSSGLSTGIYLYKVEINGYTLAGRMAVLK